MIFELFLHKADLTAASTYVVFGPRESFRPVMGGAAQQSQGFPHRPKLTLDADQWEALGKPTTISLDVSADMEVEVH